MEKNNWNKSSYAESPFEDNFFTAFANMEDALNIQELELEKIRTNPNQPRQIFDEDKIDELGKSIEEHGVFTPIIVTENEFNGYDLVAGERRFRACQKINKPTIPAIVRTFDDKQRQEVALLENIQREQLNPMEEAIAYNVILENYSLTQEELAERIGKSRSHVANLLRLNNLDKRVQIMLSNDQLTMSQARTILSEKDPQKQYEFAIEVRDKGLTTRQVESKVSNKKPKVKDYEIELLEELLQKKLGNQIEIKGNFKKGKIVIKYNQAGLNDLLDTLEISL